MSSAKRHQQTGTETARRGRVPALSTKDPAVRSAATFSFGDMGYFLDWLSLVYQETFTREEIGRAIDGNEGLKHWLAKFKKPKAKVNTLTGAAKILLSRNSSNEAGELLQHCLTEHRRLVLGPEPTKDELGAYLKDLEEAMKELTSS